MQDWVVETLGIGTLTWELQAIIKLCVAALLGAMIGIEREHHGRAAGLRTQLLVSLGAALAMVTSLHFAEIFGDRIAPSLRVDPARLAYGVMAGIGFLGAGAIIRDQASIRGLTTAASLWCTAAVGLACGFGMFLVAAAATVLVIVALVGLHRLDLLIPARQIRTVTLSIPLGQDQALQQLEDELCKKGAEIKHVDYHVDFANDRETLKFHVSLPARVDTHILRDTFRELPDATRLRIQ